MWDNYRVKSCITLNPYHNTTDWVTNATNSPIDVILIVYPPLLSYREWEVNTTGQGVNNNTLLYYEYCGPFVVLMKAFAQYIGTKYTNILL